MQTRTATIVSALLVAAAVSIYLVAGSRTNRVEPAFEDGIVRVESAYGFNETIDRVKQEIAAKGIMLFQAVDQAKLAADAGIKLNPSTLLVFGNPPLGTLFITAKAESGLDWPVWLLVQQNDKGAGVDGLHGFRLDRPPPPHHQPRCAVQDGVQRHRVHHLECAAQIAAHGRRKKSGPVAGPAFAL